MGATRSLYSDAWRRVRREPIALISLFIIVVYTLIALLAETGLLFPDYDEPVGERFEMKSLPPMTLVLAQEIEPGAQLPAGVKAHRLEREGKTITYRLFGGRDAAARDHFERVPSVDGAALLARAPDPETLEDAWTRLNRGVANFVLSLDAERQQTVFGGGAFALSLIGEHGLAPSDAALESGQPLVEYYTDEAFGLDVFDLSELIPDAATQWSQIDPATRGWIQTQKSKTRQRIVRGGPPLWRALAAAGVAVDPDAQSAAATDEHPPLPAGASEAAAAGAIAALDARTPALRAYLMHLDEKTLAKKLAGGIGAISRIETGEITLDDDALKQAGFWEVHRFWCGSDKAGRDALKLVVHGTKISMKVGLIASIIAIPIGMLLGAFAGYFGGFIDDLIVWLYTTLACVPGLLLILAIAWAIGGGLPAIYIALGATTWVQLCRLIRGEFFKLRDQDFVVAARALGAPDWRIILRHMVPNTMHLAIITFSLRFVYAILSEVVLSYIGVGVDVSQPSWGRLIQDTQEDFATQGIYWIFALTTVAMFFIVLGFNLFGDALRDALDPKLKD